MANLTRALATRPRLHTLATMLPNVWNEAMLRVSENPALERIVLADGVGAGPAQARGATWAGARAFYAAPVAAALPAPAPAAASEGVYGGSIQCTGLFFAQAKKHQRLCELIRAGTYVSILCAVVYERLLTRLVLFVQVHHTHTREDYGTAGWSATRVPLRALAECRSCGRCGLKSTPVAGS